MGGSLRLKRRAIQKINGLVKKIKISFTSYTLLIFKLFTTNKIIIIVYPMKYLIELFVQYGPFFGTYFLLATISSILNTFSVFAEVTFLIFLFLNLCSFRSSYTW